MVVRLVWRLFMSSIIRWCRAERLDLPHAGNRGQVNMRDDFRSDCVQPQPANSLRQRRRALPLEPISDVKETIMNRLFKITILSAAVAATTLTALVPADARDRWHHGDSAIRPRTATSSLPACSALPSVRSPPMRSAIPFRYRAVYDEPIYDEPIYRDPQPRPRPHRPYSRRAERGLLPGSVGLEPWSPEWFRYCGDRYAASIPTPAPSPAMTA